MPVLALTGFQYSCVLDQYEVYKINIKIKTTKFKKNILNYCLSGKNRWWIILINCTIGICKFFYYIYFLKSKNYMTNISKKSTINNNDNIVLLCNKNNSFNNYGLTKPEIETIIFI